MILHNLPREQLTVITERIISLSAIVGIMLRETMELIRQHDLLLAHSIITEREPLVNRMEAENESACIEYIARYQPEAIDLRTIVALLKINNALERIADHVVNIIQRLDSYDSTHFLPQLAQMAQQAQSMYQASIDALVNRNLESAKMVISRDQKMDEDLHSLTEEIMSRLTRKDLTTSSSISALLIARDLERIADIATNISEDTIYLIEGEINKRNAAASNSETNHYFH